MCRCILLYCCSYTIKYLYFYNLFFKYINSENCIFCDFNIDFVDVFNSFTIDFNNIISHPGLNN